MRREDTDFAAYLAARWSALVRTLVLLGCGPDEAQELGRSGLALCYRDWERIRREDDVDVVVYATVLGCLHKHRRRVPRPVREPPPDVELSDALLRHRLEGQLDRLDEDEREAVVLAYVAELSEPQIADVLGVLLDSAQARVTHGLGRLDLAGLWRELG